MDSPALAGAALLMGLAGGPHCVAMCGAVSSAVIRIVPAGGPSQATHAIAPVAFHLGRMASYAAAGAIAAASLHGLGTASAQVAAWRPLWVMLHVSVLAWGLVLAVAGRQPLWAQRAGRALEARLRPMAGGSVLGVLATGALWVAMPCGLLYSALMLAALGNGPWQGASTMALFALGSSVSLLAAPWLWQRLRGWGDSGARQAWGARLAGVLLAAVAVQALWMDLSHRIADWCG
ncbi:sulfite exporter TauE/SafE family protein [Variovorax boronicumulans]